MADEDVTKAGEDIDIDIESKEWDGDKVWEEIDIDRETVVGEDKWVVGDGGCGECGEE